MRKRIVAISRALVGKSLSHAEKVAEENGSTLRIVEREGSPLDYSTEVDNERVNIAVVDGKVARVIFLG